jgi:competence ComEA-like helix-hairpin-helix protein
MASVAFHFFNQYRDAGRVRLFEGSGGYAPESKSVTSSRWRTWIKVNLFFLDHPTISGIFNVGTGRARSYNDMAAATINAMRKGRGENALGVEELRKAGAIEYIPFPPALGRQVPELHAGGRFGAAQGGLQGGLSSMSRRGSDATSPNACGTPKPLYTQPVFQGEKTMKRLVLLFAALLAYAGLALAAVNVNTATKAELESLNGIGPVKAQAIIDYRTKNGPFKSVDDLKKVDGIGDVTLEKIRKDVSLSGRTTVADTKPAADAKKDEKKEAAKPAMPDAKSESKTADTPKTDKPGVPPTKTVDERRPTRRRRRMRRPTRPKRRRRRRRPRRRRTTRSRRQEGREEGGRQERRQEGRGEEGRQEIRRQERRQEGGRQEGRREEDRREEGRGEEERGREEKERGRKEEITSTASRRAPPRAGLFVRAP